MPLCPHNACSKEIQREKRKGTECNHAISYLREKKEMSFMLHFISLHPFVFFNTHTQPYRRWSAFLSRNLIWTFPYIYTRSGHTARARAFEATAATKPNSKGCAARSRWYQPKPASWCAQRWRGNHLRVAPCRQERDDTQESPTARGLSCASWGKCAYSCRWQRKSE